MKRMGFISLLTLSLVIFGCSSTPLCTAAGAAGGGYAGHRLGKGSTGATIGGAAAGGLLGASVCN